MFGVYKFIIQLPKCRQATLLRSSEICGDFISIRNGVLKPKLNFVRCTHSYKTLASGLFINATSKSRFISRLCTSYKSVSKTDIIRHLSSNHRNAHQRFNKEDLKHDFELIYKMKNQGSTLQLAVIAAVILNSLTLILAFVCSDFAPETIKIDTSNDMEGYMTMVPLVLGAWGIIVLGYLFHAQSRVILSIYRHKMGKCYIAIRPHWGFGEKEFHFQQKEIKVLKSKKTISVRNQTLLVQENYFVLPVYCDQMFELESSIPIIQNKKKDRKNIKQFERKMKKYSSSEDSDA